MNRVLPYLFFLLFFSSNLAVAQAHTLKTDGSIGGVLHVDPEDDPIANQTSAFVIELKDKNGTFQLANCTCVADFYRNGQKIDSEPLTPLSETNASFNFTFPQKDIYQLKVSGTSIQPGNFSPFTLTYDIRVARDLNTSSSQSPSVLKTVSAILLLIAIFGVALFKLRAKK